MWDCSTKGWTPKSRSKKSKLRRLDSAIQRSRRHEIEEQPRKYSRPFPWMEKWGTPHRLYRRPAARRDGWVWQGATSNEGRRSNPQINAEGDHGHIDSTKCGRVGIPHIKNTTDCEATQGVRNPFWCRTHTGASPRPEGLHHGLAECWSHLWRDPPALWHLKPSPRPPLRSPRTRGGT